VITSIGGPITLVSRLVPTIRCLVSSGTLPVSVTGNHLDLSHRRVILTSLDAKHSRKAGTRRTVLGRAP
jgi:hypothetical protein